MALVFNCLAFLYNDGATTVMHPPIVQEGQTGRENVEPTKAEEFAINPEHFNVSHWECSMFSADSLRELCANNP